MTGPAIKAYMSELGRKGGAKSRRKLTKRQARAMVKRRQELRAEREIARLRREMEGPE